MNERDEGIANIVLKLKNGLNYNFTMDLIKYEWQSE